jgi:hypothetical protein
MDAITPPVFGIVTHQGVEMPRLVRSLVDRCMYLKSVGHFDALRVPGNRQSLIL